MSDDTPTQRYPEGFPPPGGGPGGPNNPEPGASQPSVNPAAELPTERFDATPAAIGVPPSETGLPHGDTVPPGAPLASGDDGGRRQRGLIIGLIVAAAVLLLTLIGVLIWLATSSGSPSAEPTETPTASGTPTETPTPTPTPTPTETEEPPPPPPPPPADAISTFTASVEQADCTASGGDPVPLTFSWAASGARLWFGVGTDDAQANPFGEYPLNYTMNDVSYQCGQPGQQQRYTITVERNDGELESRTIIIREV